MANSIQRLCGTFVAVATLLLVTSCIPSIQSPSSTEKETAMTTQTSMMDDSGQKQLKSTLVGRFDLRATSVPKESVGLPADVNEVAYVSTDKDKPMSITLELPKDTLKISTSDFKMSTASFTSWVDDVTWFVQVDGIDNLNKAVAQANDHFGFTAENLSSWESKEFMSADSDQEGKKSLGMGVKNGTAIELIVYWKKDSPTQVLQFTAAISPGYYKAEVQDEIRKEGRAPISFDPNPLP